MTVIDKKAALAAYKEQKTVAGVYAIRCAPSAQVWVGQAPNLDTIQNRIWFSLRHGGNPLPILQSAWNAHGPDSLAFEVLEQVQEDSAYIRTSILKDRVSYWREHLSALVI